MYMFLHFCEMLFLELVSGDFFWVRGLFWDSIPTCCLDFFHFYLQLVTVVFWGVERSFDVLLGRNCSHAGKIEADVSDDVTASCYDRQITTQVHVHVLSCIIFYKICLPIKMLWNAITWQAVSSNTQINDCLHGLSSITHPIRTLY